MINDTQEFGPPCPALCEPEIRCEMPVTLPGEADAQPVVLGPELRLHALVLRAKSGDLSAQSDLVRQYRARLTGFVRPMVRDRETVKDIVQAIFVKMVRRLPGLRDSALFEAWLFTLARNTALDVIRRSRCRPVLLRHDPRRHDVHDPSAEDRTRDILEVVEDALRGTSEGNRRILRQIIDGASYRQVAQAEGLTMSALKVRIHRLRQEVRRRAAHALTDLSDRRPATWTS